MKAKHCLLFLFILFLSCAQKETFHHPSFIEQQAPEKGEPAIVTGKISSLEVYPHVKEIILTIPDFRGAETVYTSAIDSTGTFHFEIYPISAREITLTPLEDIIMVSPGDSIFIKKDFAEITKTKFTGEGAEVNSQISHFRNYYLGRYPFYYDLDIFEYKEKCNGLLKEYEAKLNQFIEDNETSDLFNRWAQKQIMLDYYNNLIHFPTSRSLITKSEIENGELYFDFSDEIGEIIDDEIIMIDYFTLMERYNLHTLFGRLHISLDQDTLSTEEMIDVLTQNNDNNFMNQLSVATLLNVSLSSNNVKEIEENIELMDASITHPFLRATVQQRYNKIKDYHANPQKYSDAVLGINFVERTGIGTHPSDSSNMVRQIVESNKGSVLYVNLWAPWCPPCIKDIPHHNRLHEYFSDKSVAFVNICMGGSHDEWQRSVRKHSFSGQHIYATEKEWQDINKRFNVRGIPYFLLFDKDGVMVDFGFHIKPELEGTKEEIENLLQQ